ncbi:hypothetical protein PtB15_15B151 [Puccinia triticina]|nr:hypothetical protein PtB15_15B151 [Puccinia triticina]
MVSYTAGTVQGIKGLGSPPTRHSSSHPRRPAYSLGKPPCLHYRDKPGSDRDKPNSDRDKPGSDRDKPVALHPIYPFSPSNHQVHT